MDNDFRVALIAGTSESVDYARHMRYKFKITAFCATEEGAHILEGTGCDCKVGRLDEEGFKQALWKYMVVCDASHPLAKQVSENVKNACEFLGIPYIRIVRDYERYSYKNIVHVSSNELAASYLSHRKGNILFTTDPDTLEYYNNNVKGFSLRAYVRVAKNEENNNKKISNINAAKIIEGVPPFSQKDDEDIIEDNDIKFLVTKDSGEKGGVPEKINAAQKYGIKVVMIDKEKEHGGYNVVNAEILSNRYYKEFTESLRALDEIEELDSDSMKSAHEKLDKISKPLGNLEEMVTRFAGIERTTDIKERRKAVVVVCSDNGICKESVTEEDSSVTRQKAEAICKGKASVNVFADESDADIVTIDTGMNDILDDENILDCRIAAGTQDFFNYHAMSYRQLYEAMGNGISLVEKFRDNGYNLIVAGELGVGSDITATAILCALYNMSAEEVIGNDVDISDDLMIERKKKAINKGNDSWRLRKKSAEEILSTVGGFDICTLVGIYLGGAKYHVPIFIDGYVSAVAANAAVAICPECSDYIFASHVSAEAGEKIALKKLNKKPYIDLNMSLGEGTGGLMAAKLADFAVGEYNRIADLNK